MANDPLDPLESQFDRGGNKFKSKLLSDRPKRRWPQTIDFVASRLTGNDNYQIDPVGDNPHLLSEANDIDNAAEKYYFEGIKKLIDDSRIHKHATTKIELGEFLINFAELQEGLERVSSDDTSDVDVDVDDDLHSGKILGKLLTRNLQRTVDPKNAQAVQSFPTRAETPHEWIAEAITTPKLAEAINNTLPDDPEGKTLVEQLGKIQLTTPLWDHQREALRDWVEQGMHGYVSMATATGKTVLGLAAMAYAVSPGSLHPHDEEQLVANVDDLIEPDPNPNRPNDVLVVTTDDILRAQWARLFEEHCQTPPEFTEIKDNAIKFPWGTVEIRYAGRLSNADFSPDEYGVAIFDEAHQYTKTSGEGWGKHLEKFIEKDCPILAMTASVTDDLQSIVDDADNFDRVGQSFTLEEARNEGIIPNFSWQLVLTDVEKHTDRVSHLRETAEVARELIDYKSDKLQITEKNLSTVVPKLDSVKQDLTGTYNSHAEIGMKFESKSESLNNPTEKFDTVAEMGNRSLTRTSLKTQVDIAADLASEALTNGKPTLVIPRTYNQANRIAKQLSAKSDAWEITLLEQGRSGTKVDDEICSFDDADTSQKALIGIADRIGQGVDIQTVEVGINIARPMTGANAQLVQRLGRLLRNSDQIDSVRFHHVVGVQPCDTVLPVDGESFVTNMAQFFGDIAEPEDKDALSPPDIDLTTDTVVESVIKLEQCSLNRIDDTDRLTEEEAAYTEAIREIVDSSDNQLPALPTDWVSKMNGADHMNPKPECNDTNAQVDSEDISKSNVQSDTNNSPHLQPMNSSTSETDDAQSTGDSDNIKTESVTIDPMLIGLVELAANDESIPADSQRAVVERGLDNLLKESIGSTLRNRRFSTGDDRQLEIRTDDTLEQYLTRLTEMQDDASTPADILMDALRSEYGLDGAKTVPVPVNEYEQLIAAFTDSDDTDCENRADVVEVALRQQFDIT